MKNIFIIVIMFPFLFACGDAVQTERTISTDTSAETSCPFLTTDNKENIVLSWVKERKDISLAAGKENSVMCYAISTDKGNSFGQAIEIPSSKGVHPHGENLPKIIFKPSGEIIAIWGASNQNPNNKYSGMVYYAQSFDEGKTWSNAIPLVHDTSSYDQRYFDIAVLSNGEAAVIWLDNREKEEKEGSSIYFAVTNGTKGFQNEKAIGETCCPCCRTDFFVDSRGIVHVAYRDIINDSIRDMVHLVSIDKGKTFSQPQRISDDNWIFKGCPHTGPTMTENKNGLHFAWFTMGGGSGVFYSFTKDNGKTYSMRDSVSSKQSAKHPQITTLPNGNIVIVWDETISKGEKYNSWIGLQNRTTDGKIISTQYVTSDDVTSTFPVIKAIDDSITIVGWVQKISDSKNKQVFYKIIHIKQ